MFLGEISMFPCFPHGFPLKSLWFPLVFHHISQASKAKPSLSTAAPESPPWEKLDGDEIISRGDFNEIPTKTSDFL